MTITTTVGNLISTTRAASESGNEALDFLIREGSELITEKIHGDTFDSLITVEVSPAFFAALMEGHRREEESRQILRDILNG